MNDLEDNFLDNSSIKRITQGIREGSEKDFDLFYSCYARRIFKYLFTATKGNQQLAKDVHQESMVRIIRYMKVFEDEKYLWNWLMKVTNSTLVDFYRRHNKNIAVDLLEMPNPNQESNNSSLLSALDSAIKKLDSDQQDFIADYYFQNIPQKIMAEKYDLSQQAIGMRIMRIRKTLKSLMTIELSNE